MVDQKPKGPYYVWMLILPSTGRPKEERLVGARSTSQGSTRGRDTYPLCEAHRNSNKPVNVHLFQIILIHCVSCIFSTFNLLVAYLPAPISAC
jgi:hypothetical protein